MKEKNKLRLKIALKYFECAMDLNKLATGLNDDKFFNDYLVNRAELDEMEKRLKAIKMEERNHEKN